MRGGVDPDPIQTASDPQDFIRGAMDPDPLQDATDPPHCL